MGSKKILIIEDEGIVRTLEFKFRNSGFVVDIACDGVEAMQKLHDNRPDVILLDVLLPGMDGLTVLQRIRADKDLGNIPVLVFSNFGDQAFIERARILGVIGYVVKANTKLDDLVKKVSDYFEKK